jgi:hypothetical protein
LAEQGRDGGGGPQSGVDPAFERDDEDGPIELGLVVDNKDLGQPVGTHAAADAEGEGAIWADEVA